MRKKSEKLSKIFYFPPSNSGLTKRNVLLVKKSDDDIPVYSASKDKEFIFGWIPKDSKWKSYENALTWNTDGVYAGCVFYRNHKFVPYEKIKVLKLKEEYKDKLHYPFLEVSLEMKLRSMGFGFRKKCSMNMIKNIYMNIPTDNDKNFDVDKQKELAEDYKKIKQIIMSMNDSATYLNKYAFKINLKHKLKKINFNNVFTIKKGNSKYTKTYVMLNHGAYPIFSADTLEGGIFGYVNFFDYDTDCLQITTNGVNAGAVFYRQKQKFSINADAMILVKTEENLWYPFLLWELRKKLKEQNFGWNKKINEYELKEIFLEIPIDNEGKFDVKAQKDIASKLDSLETIKNEVLEGIKEITDSVVLI